MTTPVPRTSVSQKSVQMLAAVTSRREALAQVLYRAQANHEHSKAALAQAQKVALEKYATCDVAELRQQFATINSENQSKLRKADEELNFVETSLRDLNARVMPNSESAGA